MKYRLIGIYEIFTGIFGLLLLVINIGKVLDDSSTFFTFFVGLTLFAGLAAAGYILMKQQQEAARYSIWVQALQVVSITYAGKQYLFTASAFISVLYSGNAAFNYQLSPINFNISEVSTQLPLEIRIYILPVILIAILLIGKKD